VQYQGFRQVLGTTQVFPVPTLLERQGYDATAYPGDTLIVPVIPTLRILARYPLPNLPTGSYGVNTYAASSKVTTNANQFSVRLDHRLSAKGEHLMARFNFNNILGRRRIRIRRRSIVSFGVTYIDHQRNGVLDVLRRRCRRGFS
jgi:hypothetical protein